MSTLKLFGFTAEEQQSLSQQAPTSRWEPGRREELGAPRPDGEVWLVRVDAAEEFLNAVFPPPAVPRPPSPPPAVLWVPRGQEPLPLDDWWEGFSVQLRGASEADMAFLKKIARCGRVLAWGERVEDLPTEWFAGLTGSPRLLTVPDLPFNEEEKAHLERCPDCREEAIERLQGRAERRWTMLCPTVEEIAAWLEEEAKKPRLEEHVRGCALCRETVKRQAFLWEGAELLTSEQVDAKLAAVGLVDWITAEWNGAMWDLVWQPAGTETVRASQPAMPTETQRAWALLLALVLCRRTPLRPAWRTAGAPATEAEVSLEELQSYLDADEAVTFLGEEQWLHLSAADDAVWLRAGRSAADDFKQFRVEFRRGEEAVVSVSAEGGVARLTAEHFQAAQERGADRVVISRW